MKIKRIIYLPVILTLIFAACSMPESPFNLLTQEDLQEISTPESETPPESPSETETETETEMSISIETDTVRNQGVYINEKGLRIDIESTDYLTGESVKCIQIADFAILEITEPSKNTDPADTEIKAVVVGTRNDGQPGIWEIHSDDSIQAPWNEDTGTRTSLLVETLERQESLRGRFNWTYEVTGISDDGKVAVGYAVHEDGIKHGRWIIDPGTTVGVYWRLWNTDRGYKFGTRRAKIIGIKIAPYNYRHRNWQRDHFIRILSRLRLFFIGWFETYLTMAETINYDDNSDVYLVKGIDETGTKATAVIDLRQGVISIDQDGTTEEYPDLTVAAITVPGTLLKTTDTWELGARISNIDASIDAGSSTLEYYLSEDSTLDTSSDTLIGSKAIGSISAGSYVDDIWSSSYSIPQGGIWYIFAIADADSEVTESNEENNSLSATAIVIYNGIVIETFSPTGVGTNSTVTHLALFDSAGDPSPETPYDDTGALAQDELSNAAHFLYSYINYTGALAPGTYYIKVRGSSLDQTGPYGIRIIPDSSEPYIYFSSTNPASAPWDDSYENDDSMTGGIPDNPLSIKAGVQEDWHNRSLADSDIDWFILTLE